MKTGADRIPWGYAKRILVAMQPGDQFLVRPEHVEAFRHAAKRLKISVGLRPTFSGGRWVYRMAMAQAVQPIAA